MKRTLIIAAWLVGMTAIAWSCTSHQVALHSSAAHGTGHAVAPACGSAQIQAAAAGNA